MRVLTHFGQRSVQQIVDAVPGVEAVDVPTSGPVPDDLTGDALLTLAWASDNLADLFLANVERRFNDRPLEGVVDLVAGY